MARFKPLARIISSATPMQATSVTCARPSFKPLARIISSATKKENPSEVYHVLAVSNRLRELFPLQRGKV